MFRKLRRYCLFAGLMLAICSSMILSSIAAERQVEFLRGLREKQYYDTALFYVEKQRTRKDLAPELSARLQYEEATLLLESASVIRNPKARQRRLNEAAEALALFVKQHPDHAQVGSANRELARVHLNNARVLIWEANSAKEKSSQSQLQADARKEIELARSIFRTALPQLKKAFDQFLPHINEKENRQQFLEKKKLEQSIINSRLELAKCTYEEAQSYPRGSTSFRGKLNRAIEEFQLLHYEFRSQTGGHYARLWQGKCYEERDEITKAIGIYNEILGHPQSSAAVQRLQDLATEFRLICLNHDKMKNYSSVAQEASYWLSNSRKRRYTTAGLGIVWQRAKAYDAIAQGMPKSTSQKSTWRRALSDAEEVQRYPGRYRGVAAAMTQRLNLKLKGEAGTAKEFSTAFDKAQQLVNQLQPIKQEWDEVRKTPNASTYSKRKQAFEDHLAETYVALNVASEFRVKDSEQAQWSQVLYYYAYLDYLTQKSYDAAVRAGYVVKYYATIDPEIAQRAALLATASYAQAFNEATTSTGRASNLKMMVRAANRTLKVWPQSETASSCCQLVGQAYSQLKLHREAADWYFKTPGGTEREPHHRILAGQALWQAFLKDRAAEKKTQTSSAQTDVRYAKVEQALQEGIQLIGKSSSEIPIELITGKATLAELYADQNQYSKAIDLLTKQPASVVDAINDSLDGEGKLALSDSFANSVYRLLLRAYVSSRDIENALKTMGQVEKLSQKSGQASSAMAIYVQLGKELERELKGLEAAGEHQKTELTRQNFEQFLVGLLEQQAGQSFSSLFWIAETYASLANSLPDTKSEAAQRYFLQAKSAYQQILVRAVQETGFVKPEQKLGIQLRLASVQRQLQEYAAALKTIQVVLQANPNSLLAQYEAASLLQAQGMSDEPEAIQAIQKAVQGDELLWGWSNIAKRLQRMQNMGQLDEDLQTQFYESRYNIALCRQKLAELYEENTNEKQRYLGAAEQEIVTLFSVSGNVPTEWYTKFDALYLDLRHQQGKPQNTIAERLQLAEQPNAKAAPQTNESRVGNSVRSGNQPTQETKESSSLSPELLVGVVVGMGGLLFVVILFVGTRKKTKRKRRQNYHKVKTSSIPNGSAKRAAKAKSKAVLASGQTKGEAMTKRQSSPQPPKSKSGG